MLAAINAETGSTWGLGERMRLGMLGGAWRIHHGPTVAVLKWHDPGSITLRNVDAPKVVEHIRRQGYPTPAWLAWGTTATGATWWIQELVGGEPQLALDLRAARRVLDLIRLQRTICPPTEFDWNAYVRMTVAGAPHALRGIAAPYESAPLPDNEMVHGDLSLANILLADGRLAGVVDIDAAGRGCAVYDVLAVVTNGLAWNGDADAIAHLMEFAWATYDAAAVRLTAVCLAWEAIDWASHRHAHRVPELTELYQDWLRPLQ